MWKQWKILGGYEEERPILTQSTDTLMCFKSPESSKGVAVLDSFNQTLENLELFVISSVGTNS